MTDDTERLERELADDLAKLGDRLIDEKFATELYRALTDNIWFRDEDGPERHLALSWKRAEDLVNELRARVDRPPLTLAQTGGEGQVSRTVDDELGRLGWSHRPLDTGEHDERHVGEPAETPPPASRPGPR
jgi:hypothetical protein